MCLTNVNRQLYATRSTVGRYKVEVAEERIRDINPDCRVRAWKTFYMPDTQDQFDFTEYDYIVDAIDTVKGKLTLVEAAKAAGTIGRTKPDSMHTFGAGTPRRFFAVPAVRTFFSVKACGQHDRVCLPEGKPDGGKRADPFP